MTRLNEPRSLGMTCVESRSAMSSPGVCAMSSATTAVSEVTQRGVVVERGIAAQLEGIDDVAVVGDGDGPDGAEPGTAVRTSRAAAAAAA